MHHEEAARNLGVDPASLASAPAAPRFATTWERMQQEPPCSACGRPSRTSGVLQTRTTGTAGWTGAGSASWRRPRRCLSRRGGSSTSCARWWPTRGCRCAPTPTRTDRKVGDVDDDRFILILKAGGKPLDGPRPRPLGLSYTHNDEA
ncbi:hypothetical protein GCM10010228_80530 [Streptomyces massasporeus]|nr:hypothetical protein GCM10010228_80530 [Streptomyces massasporeus]